MYVLFLWHSTTSSSEVSVCVFLLSFNRWRCLLSSLSLDCYLTKVFFYLFNRHHNWSSLYHQAQILLSSHAYSCRLVLLQPMVLIASTKFTRRLSRSFFFFFFFSARCLYWVGKKKKRMDNGEHSLFSIDDSLEYSVLVVRS